MILRNVKWCIIILVLVIIVVIGIFLIFNKETLNFIDDFKLDSSNKYEIITDMKWHTVRDDGGSNTSIYYQVDFDNNTVRKVKEQYEANLGGRPKTTKEVIYDKVFDDVIKEDFKTLLSDIMEKEDENETKNYMFFEIKSLNYEKNIFNEDTINDIKMYLEKIDRL